MLLCVCVYAYGEPLGEALRRRSDYGVYASDFSRDYEPYMYAAIPLHAPVPVLRILSRVPLGHRDRKHAPSVHHPVYARPPYADTEYVSSAHSDYEAASYEPQQYTSSGYATVPYAKHYQMPQLYAAASSAPEEPAILYARPNPQGGYTYHKQPNKHAAKRAPPSDTPYIIRVHKYRIVKER